MPEAKDFQFRLGFDHNEQIKICTAQLEALRDGFEAHWEKLSNDDGYMKEYKNLAKHIIRVSSESCDHQHTVDFVTKSVLAHLELSAQTANRALMGHLRDSKKLAHEHMVPIQAALKHLLSLKGERLEEPLRKVGYRALILRSEADEHLDRRGNPLRNNVPQEVIEHGVPLQFWGLARYEKAVLFDELEPITQRAKDLHAAYEPERNKVRSVMGLPPISA